MDAFHGYVYDNGTACCYDCADAEHDADLAQLDGAAKTRFEQTAGLKVAGSDADRLRTAWIDHLIFADGAWPRDTSRYLEGCDEVGIDVDDPETVHEVDDDDLAVALTDVVEDVCVRCGRLLAEVCDEPLPPALTALLAAGRRRGLLPAAV